MQRRKRTALGQTTLLRLQAMREGFTSEFVRHMSHSGNVSSGHVNCNFHSATYITGFVAGVTPTASQWTTGVFTRIITASA